MPDNKKIDVIGIDVIDQPLSQEKQQYVKKADVLIGGRKHLESMTFFKGRTISITRDIPLLIENIKQALEQELRIVVLATGDPLLFGIANTLIDHFGINAIEVHPGISAVQVALSRLGIKTNQAVILSRHGTHDDDLRKILYHPVSVILTSHAHSPGEIIHELMEKYPQTRLWQGHVCQCLGMEAETVQSANLEQLVDIKTFQTPNLLVIENPVADSQAQASVDFGRPDSNYAYDGNMITHPEIRAVTLSKLELSNGATVWDVGAGSGSVGIEAALLYPHLTVYSIEKNAGRFKNIIANAKKFKTDNLQPVQGNAVDVCLTLPQPDRVFIGGGGENLAELLACCYERLTDNGQMVINTVTIESSEVVNRFFKQIQKEIECVSIQVSRRHKLAGYHTLKPDNAITVFGIKKISNI